MYKKFSCSPCLFGPCDEALLEVKSFSISTQCKRNRLDCLRKSYQKLYRMLSQVSSIADVSLSLSRFLLQFAVTETLPIPWSYFVAQATQVFRATGAYAHVAFYARQNQISFDYLFREGSGFFLRWVWIIWVKMFQTVVEYALSYFSTLREKETLMASLWKYLKFSIKKFYQTMVFCVQFATHVAIQLKHHGNVIVTGRWQTLK